MNQRLFPYYKTKPFSILFCMFCFLLLTWFAGNLVAEAKEFADTSSDSKDTMVELVDETLSRANQLRLSGRLEEAAAEWERAFVLDPEYMHQHGAFSKPWVHLFLKLGLRKQALEIYKTGYTVTPNPGWLTTDERVAWGERLIFGQEGGRSVPGAIGKGQCPLCHEFGKVHPNKRLRAPMLSGISRRIPKLLATKEYQQRGKTVQPYAFEGSGIATTVVEYLAESKACPSCYVVPGFGMKGSEDRESPEPKVHAAPIGLSVDEMILVDSWLLKEEGMELPAVATMRAAYHKFLEQPQDHVGSTPDSLFLAHLYDLNGHEGKALELLHQHYEGVLRYEEESSLELRRLGLWRENPEMFPHLRKRPEVVKQFPKLFQPTENWRATDVSVENLDFEYVSYAFHTYSQYPRWFPDSQRVLYTVCHPEKPCEIWSAETSNPWNERVLSDASFGDPSPDGTRLVFIRAKKIYLHDLHTKQSVQLIDVLPNALTPPVWNQAGDELEVMTADSPSSSCQTLTFNLTTKSWISRASNPWEQTWMWQGLPKSRTFDFVGLNNFHGKCQVRVPTRVASNTSGWQRWYDDQWDGKSSLARLLVTPALHWRDRRNPLWLVAHNEKGALEVPYSAVTPVLSPNGRYMAYEFRNKEENPIRGNVGIVIGLFKKQETPLPKFFVEFGGKDGLKPGMSLLVYYGNALDSSEERIPFEEDLAIGGVRVLEVTDSQAIVQQSIFHRGIYREGQHSHDNRVLPGDLVVTSDFKEWAPLKPHN